MHFMPAFVVAATSSVLAVPVVPTHSGSDPADSPPVKLPIAFVENRGQWNAGVSFVARRGGQSLFVTPRGFILQSIDVALPETPEMAPAPLHGTNLFFTLESPLGEEPSVEPASAKGVDELPGRRHFLLGRDPRRHVRDARGFAAVRLSGVAPGIALVVHEGTAGFEYDLELAQDASRSNLENLENLANLVLRCDGADALGIAADGSLLATTRHGTLRQPPPRAWFVGTDGAEHPVDVTFRLVDGQRFGFTLHGAGAPGAASRLVIDPGLEWSTYFGGSEVDRIFDAAVTADGTTTIAGRGLSTDLPTTPGCFDDSYNGDSSAPERVGDVFLARFAPDGATLAWCTYLGGSGNDHAQELLLAANGEPIVSGWTGSDDFPTTPGCYDDSFNGLGAGLYLGGDVFVTRLANDGGSQVASTLLGGTDLEYTIGMGLGSDESVYVTGHVHSDDFPVTPGTWQQTRHDHSEIFVSRLSADLTTLVASTYYGGTGEEYSHCLVVSPDGSVTVAGSTNSPDMPVTPNVIDASYDGGDSTSHSLEGFVTRFTPDLAQLTFCTYLGKAGTDTIYSMQLAPDGGVVLAGDTSSTDFFTTPGAYDETWNGGFDAYVLELSSDATAIEWGTYLGGEGSERAEGVFLESSGGLIVTGRTASVLFPVTAGCYDPSYNSGTDVFVTRLTPGAAALRYSTFIGHSFYEVAHDVAVDGTDAATLAGETFSTKFPTTPGAFDVSYNLKGDAFVTRVDLLPTGATKYGRSTAGCAGLLAIGITGFPQEGVDFGLTCSRAPASAAGFLGLAFGRLDPPLSISGIDLFLDPASGLFLILPAVSDATGAAEFVLHGAPGTAGVTFTSQFFWPDACGPQGFSSSNALEVTIQP